MSTIRMDITNTNNAGAGSLRQALSDQVSGRPYRMQFTASGTVALGSQLSVTKPYGLITGQGQQVVIASNYAAGGAYTNLVAADGVTLEHLAFDNTASGGTGATLLLGDGTASDAQPYTGVHLRHCYVRGNNDDSLGILGRVRTIRCEYCIFDGTANGLGAALLASLDDLTNPKNLRIVFKHCLFVGGGRVPDITFGVVDVLGCVIARKNLGGRIWAGARVNLVNNWMVDHLAASNGATIQLISGTYNGDSLADGSVYSAGNYRNGISEAAYGDGFYSILNSDTAPAASLFSTRPIGGTIEPVPSARRSRQLTLAYAGCYLNRTANDAAAIGKSINRQ